MTSYSPARRGVADAVGWVWAVVVVWALFAGRSLRHLLVHSPAVAFVLALLAVATGRRFARKLWAYGRVVPRCRRNVSDLLRFLAHRPLLLGAVATYEAAALVNSRLDTRLKYLASTKASSLIGCPF